MSNQVILVSFVLASYLYNSQKIFSLNFENEAYGSIN